MTFPSFAMHDLGWFAFQQLCHTILREVLGQTVQSFLSSKDGGRDGAFQGVWDPRPGETLTGAFVVQCKHTGKANNNLRLSDLKDELENAERLVRQGRCTVYILMTNAGLGGTTEAKIQAAFVGKGVHEVRVFGADWMNQTIAEHSRLRRLVPRLYGLGDLTQILDERAYRQARAVLDSMRTDLDKLVLTSTYEQAAAALEHHGFVLLYGAPATGKTTIAAQLALGSADEFDTAVVKLDSAADFQHRWNPDDLQLFWLDDAFGATQLEHTAARAWAKALPLITSAIRGGSKMVLTSRDYIFTAARPFLKPGAFPLFEESKVVVDVLDLEPDERRQILYNHLRHGQQPDAWIQKLKPHLESAASHPGFTPELARRLSHPHFTQNVSPFSARSVEQFFAHPDDFLRDIMEGLDADAQSALGLIFVHHDWLPSPVEFDDRNTDLISRLGGTVSRVGRALDAMDGSLVRNIRRESQQGWVFTHPTMVDAYAQLMRSPELHRHLLVGFPLGVLMSEVTCGEVGIEGALEIAPALYDVVLDRLDEPYGQHAHIGREHAARRSFLATRCDAAFLQLWADRHADDLEQLAKPGLMLEWSVGNELVARLNEFGLFPDPLRARFAEGLADYCIDGTDPAVLWDRTLRSVLVDAEWEALLIRVRSELLSNLSGVLAQCTDGHDWREIEPSDVVEPLSRLVIELPDLFPGDDYVEERAQHLDSLLQDWIADAEQDHMQHRDESENGVDTNSGGGDVDGLSNRSDTRSIFDDLLIGRSVSL